MLKHLTLVSPGRVPQFSEQSSVNWQPTSLPEKQSIVINTGTNGLDNPGNTCYINSVLQCLNGTSPLWEFFFNDTYKSQMAHIHEDNPPEPGKPRLRLAEEFAKVIRDLRTGSGRSISPIAIKVCCLSLTIVKE